MQGEWVLGQMMIAEHIEGGAHRVYEAGGIMELLINKMTEGCLPTLPAYTQKAGDRTPYIFLVKRNVIESVSLSVEREKFIDCNDHGKVQICHIRQWQNCANQIRIHLCTG